MRSGCAAQTPPPARDKAPGRSDADATRQVAAPAFILNGERDTALRSGGLVSPEPVRRLTGTPLGTRPIHY